MFKEKINILPVPIPTIKRTTKIDQVRGCSMPKASCGTREMRENMALPAMNVPAHKRLMGRTLPSLSASRPNRSEKTIWPRASAAITKPYMVSVAEGSSFQRSGSETNINIELLLRDTSPCLF